MIAFITQVSEETSKSTAYKIGYEVGYFVGAHFYETLAVFLLAAALILYLVIFRRKES